MKDRWGESKYPTSNYRLLVKAVNTKREGRSWRTERKKGMVYVFIFALTQFFTVILQASVSSCFLVFFY